MKRYVTAYISFFDNELTQKIISAESEVDALKAVLVENDIEPYNDLETVEALKQFAFDCDSIVSAIEI